MAANWTDKQKQAIYVSGRSSLVAAAAGSGKTAVLVERIIKKITDENHPVDIDRLVVVTFTKAAAAEMRQRIREALDNILESSPGNENIIRQQSLIHNAKITTIDSFCLNIVRNYFSDIDVDPGFRTADDGEIKLLENDVMDDMLEEYYSSGNEDFLQFVDAYGTGRDDSKIVDIIMKIYNAARSCPWEDEWYEECLENYLVTEKSMDSNPCIQYLFNDLKKSLEDFDGIFDKLEKICQSPDGPAGYLATVSEDHQLIKMLINSENFEMLVKRINLSSFGNIGRCSKGVDEEKKNYVKQERDNFKNFLTKDVKGKLITGDINKIYKDIVDNTPAVRMMVHLALEFSQRMSGEKKRRNVIDFNDMEHMALNILIKRENGQKIRTDAAKTLAGFYEEILIDEYQDSNLLQEVILTAVSKDGQNIYMVGDVKQSIYKFRMACPELFIEKYNSYDVYNSDSQTDSAESLDAVKIELQTNFRSRRNVLECTNDVFYRLMNESYCGMAYNDEVRLNTGLVYPECPPDVIINAKKYKTMNFGMDDKTEIYAFESDDDTDSGSHETEAGAVADIIENLMSCKNGRVYMVYDKNADGGYRPLRYSDIVILTRTVSGWAESFVNTLMSRDIPAYSDTSQGYFSVREIQILVSFLTVIDNPLQDIPLSAVMLSYFGRFDTTELATIRQTDKKTRLYNQLTSLEKNEKVAKFLKLLNSYRVKSEIMSVYDLLWDVIYNTGYYDYVKTMPAGERRQANLDMLLYRAAQFEKTSYSGLFNFLRYIERMKKFEVEIGEASLLGENDNLVRVMSIHKSKGLEFPVVILTGMGKKINNKDAAGDVVIDRELGIGTNVVRVKERTKSQTIIKSAVSKKIIRDNISEEMRILYVAMTRAREKLFITGTVKDEGKAEETWHSKSIFLAEKGIFDYADDASCQNYFDMVMPQALMDESVNNGRFFVTFGKPQDFFDTSGASYMDDFVQTDAVTQTDAAVVVDESIENDYDENPQEDFETQNQEIVELPEYPYENDTERKAKVTVSELKQMQHDSDFDEKSQMHESIAGITDTEEDDEPVPSFMSDEEAVLKGSRRGSAYHRIMECIDYGKLPDNEDEMIDSIKSEIADMLSDEKIDKSQKQCVKVRDIAAFCTSQIGKRVKNASMAGKVWREQPFVFEMTDENDQAFGQLIQGVIDLYIVENDEITIVDYKTDRVLKGKKGEEELRSRYSIQLDYYAKALSCLTGLNVKEKIIYSFTLGYAIDV